MSFSLRHRSRTVVRFEAIDRTLACSESAAPENSWLVSLRAEGWATRLLPLPFLKLAQRVQPSPYPNPVIAAFLHQYLGVV